MESRNIIQLVSYSANLQGALGGSREHSEGYPRVYLQISTLSGTFFCDEIYVQFIIKCVIHGGGLRSASLIGSRQYANVVGL